MFYVYCKICIRVYALWCIHISITFQLIFFSKINWLSTVNGAESKVFVFLQNQFRFLLVGFLLENLNKTRFLKYSLRFTGKLKKNFILLKFIFQNWFLEKSKKKVAGILLYVVKNDSQK